MILTNKKWNWVEFFFRHLSDSINQVDVNQNTVIQPQTDPLEIDQQLIHTRINLNGATEVGHVHQGQK